MSVDGSSQTEVKVVEKEPVGNELFQRVVFQPLVNAVSLMKALGTRKLTTAQVKRKRKNRAKRKSR